MRIVLSNPKNTEMNQSVYIDRDIVMKDHGPGSYDVGSDKRKNANVVDWSKSNVKRFKHKKDKNPGPGSYEVDHLPRRTNSCLSSSFAYQGLRSYLDE